MKVIFTHKDKGYERDYLKIKNKSLKKKAKWIVR